MTTAPALEGPMIRRTTQIPLLSGLAVSVALLMGGCAPYPLFGQDPVVATGTIEVPTTDALVLPEPGAAPRVIAVLETQYLNALEQEIVLATNSSARARFPARAR